MHPFYKKDREKFASFSFLINHVSIKIYFLKINFEFL